MHESLLVPIQVFGMGFAISLGIATLIKIMMYSIRLFTKED